VILKRFRKGTAMAVPFRYLGPLNRYFELAERHFEGCGRYFGSADSYLGLAGVDEPVVAGVSIG